jgi:nicotinamide riboside kinase
MARIGICGSMSVGKTTLVKALAQLPEFKDYTCRTERSKELMAQGIPLNTDSTLKGQCVFLAERASELMNENVLTDRTIIDVMAFAICSKSMNYNEILKFNTLACELIKEYDYIFYISPEGVDIEDNGVRTIDPNYRTLIDNTINALISEYVVNPIKLVGTTEERISKIKQVLSL